MLFPLIKIDMQRLTTPITALFGWLLASLVSLASVQAQDISGAWHGILDVQGQKVPLVFHFENVDGHWQGTMDSPAQGALGIPLTDVALADSQLVVGIAAAGIRYEGRIVAADSVAGTFHQGGLQLPLALQRNKEAAATPAVRRPQEPQPPFPYQTEEVTFAGGHDGVRLAGTRTLPDGEGPWPAAVVLAGSGPNDRDQHLFGHKTLLVIADDLARRGIATLRYDKRGVAASEGAYATATARDFADDARAACDYLSQRAEIDPARVGLIGHSEGGMIAPLVAGDRPDVAFLALLAAPGIPIDSLMVIQNHKLGQTAGMNDAQLAQALATNREIYRLLREIADSDSLHAELDRLLREQALANGIPAEQIDPFVAAQVQQLASPWHRYFINYDPEPALVALKAPVLAINGENDQQVTAKENLHGIASALRKGGNTQVTIKAFPTLNHLLQESETGAVSESATIEQTVAPVVLETLSHWIKQVTTR